MNHTIKKYLTLTMFLFISPHMSYAGQSTGNGGDSIVADFISTGESLISWLRTKNFDQFSFDLIELEDAFEKVKPKISSTNEPLFIGGIEKDAINNPITYTIVINRDRWILADQPTRKWRIVAHELLGVMGRPDSDYSISDFIVKEAFKTISDVHILISNLRNRFIIFNKKTGFLQKETWAYDFETKEAFLLPSDLHRANFLGVTNNKLLIIREKGWVVSLLNPVTKEKEVLLEDVRLIWSGLALGGNQPHGDIEDILFYQRTNGDKKELSYFNLDTRKVIKISTINSDNNYTEAFRMPRGEIIYIYRENKDKCHVNIFDPRYRRSFRLDTDSYCPVFIAANSDDTFLAYAGKGITQYSLINNEKKYIINNEGNYTYFSSSNNTLFFIPISISEAKLRSFNLDTNTFNEFTSGMRTSYVETATVTNTGDVIYAQNFWSGRLMRGYSDGTSEVIFKSDSTLECSKRRIIEYLKTYSKDLILIGLSPESNCGIVRNNYDMDLWFFDLNDYTFKPVEVKKWNY